MPVWLAAARAVHYGACTGLFGLSLFQHYGSQPARFRAWLAGLGVAALISGAAWFALVTFDLAGGLDGPALAAIVTQTSFGPVWLARLALALAASLLIGLSPQGRRTVPGLLAGLLLASIALTGHTQIHDGPLRAAHVVSDAIHLLAAGAWIGGLAGLILTLSPDAGPANAPTVGRFSQMGYLAVAGLIVSGLVNAAILVRSPANLIGSPYGRLLLLKLALFAAMLFLAAANRLLISPRLAGPNAASQVRALRRNAAIEQGIALGVLVCVAFLGMGEPPG